MKFLCLAYGSEGDWENLTPEEQNEVLAADDVIREKGNLVGAVSTDVSSLRAWERRPVITAGSYSQPGVPLAGFGIIEAETFEQVAELLKNTPCARAKGVVEIREITESNA